MGGAATVRKSRGFECRNGSKFSRKKEPVRSWYKLFLTREKVRISGMRVVFALCGGKERGGARQKNPGGVQHWSGMPDYEPAASVAASVKQSTAARQTKVPDVFCSCQICQVVRAVLKTT